VTERFTTAAKVGLFTVALLVAGLFVYRFVSRQANIGDGYSVYVLMDNASGIAKHSRVKIAGIPVGNIQSIRLEDGKARIDIGLEDGIVLHDNASVSKVASSLLGEYHLAIAPGTTGLPVLKSGDRIKLVYEAVSTDELLKDMSEITHDVKKITSGVANAIGNQEGQEYLRQTMQNLAEVTVALNETVRENRETVRAILVNIEGFTRQSSPDLTEIVNDVNAITSDVRALISAEGEPEPGAIRQVVNRMNTASQNLQSALSNIDDVSGKLARGEGTLGRLINDDQLIDDVGQAAQDLSEYVEELKRLQTIVSLRSDYQFLSNTVKSYIDVRLQPTEDKYYLVGVVNDPRGLTQTEQIVVQTDNPEDPPQYREVRTVTSNRLRFNAQFAQTFGAFTGRFGIVESTGGFGLDIALFDDRFEIRQDVFGFGEVVRPRWRLTFGYEFLARLWLLGGADDILTSQQRDYFIGLQLRFNDRDLKALLPFASSL
jgi:phospholipid/cholesterol/gamma-HCH transport system substrate-binding protein